jgi:hypothetical protein
VKGVGDVVLNKHVRAPPLAGANLEASPHVYAAETVTEASVALVMPEGSGTVVAAKAVGFERIMLADP